MTLDYDTPSYLHKADLPQSFEGAPHIGHSNHLCEICQRGDCTLAQFKALVRDPNFICRKCGRVAANEENLCEPVSLE